MNIRVEAVVTTTDRNGMVTVFGLGMEMLWPVSGFDPGKTNARNLRFLMDSVREKLTELKCPVEPWEET